MAQPEGFVHHRLDPCAALLCVHAFCNGALGIHGKELEAVLVAVESRYHELFGHGAVGYAGNVFGISGKVDLFCLAGLHVVAVQRHPGVGLAGHGVAHGLPSGIEVVLLQRVAGAAVQREGVFGHRSLVECHVAQVEVVGRPCHGGGYAEFLLVGPVGGSEEGAAGAAAFGYGHFGVVVQLGTVYVSLRNERHHA